MTHQLTMSMPSVTRRGTTLPDSVTECGWQSHGKFTQCRNNSNYQAKWQIQIFALVKFLNWWKHCASLDLFITGVDILQTYF